jgi:uncharacterized membrane protein
MNFQIIIKNIKKIDKKILKIVKTGLTWSFVFCLIASYVLVIYAIMGEPNAYYIGLSLFKSGLFFIVGFIICGVAFNRIMNDYKN